MFSFMKIATFAALVFGTLASAIPAPAPVPVADASELAVRDIAAASTLTDIITNMNTALKAPTTQMSSLTAANATPDNVKTIVLKIQVILQAAVDACNKSPSTGSGNILLLLSITINLVITACNKCYSVCTDKVDVLVVLQLLDSVLAALITIVLKLVGGVLATVVALLVGLLGTVVQLLVSLKFTLCLKALLVL